MSDTFARLDRRARGLLARVRGRNLVIGIPYLWLLLFFVVPFLIVFKISFSEVRLAMPPYAPLFEQAADGSRMVAIFNLGNYGYLLTDSLYFSTFLYSLKVAAVSTLLCLLIGYPMAYAIARTDSAFLRRLLIAAVVVTFLSGSVTRAYGWLVILGNRGLLNGMMIALGLREQPVQMIFNHTGVFVALLHFVVPFFVLTLVGTVRNVPRSLEDAARNLGASAWTAFRRVTLPLTLPGIVAGMTLCFGLGLSAFLFPLMLGGGRVRLMANFIYDEIFTSFNLPFAAATSAIFLACALALLAAFNALQGAVGRRPGRAA